MPSSPDTQANDQQLLQRALAELHATAANFANVCITDARVRAQYVTDSVAASKEIAQAVQAGKMTAKAGAELAQEMRNEIMELSRLRSSPVGRAYAKKLKLSGKTLGELADKYAKDLFKKAFAELGEAQQARVYTEIVNAAGRPNPSVIAKAKFIGKIGQRLVLVSLAVAIYEIYEAEDKPREIARQSVIAGAGVAGGAAVGAGAVATGVCAATAPVCVGVAVLIGGLLFATGADLTFGTLYPSPTSR
ncbi:hypothetical protein OOT46_11265 [Aquabacterium sp. A7-Y]|uniref:hypothetical protein n=1 Tax=Aquabacterium sp. A7-Y TaxID=1349605 RepID=UPI00223CDC86|nr:hypothetical protein [Aquabacterium sp. A7-Y]MCW7538419.1 hypothetical protein [Aquabacterium sp. A7-Y]